MCQVLTSGRPFVEKDGDSEFSGRVRKRIAVAHSGEFIGGAHEGPDRLAHVSHETLLEPRPHGGCRFALVNTHMCRSQYSLEMKPRSAQIAIRWLKASVPVPSTLTARSRAIYLLGTAAP